MLPDQLHGFVMLIIRFFCVVSHSNTVFASAKNSWSRYDMRR